MFAKCADIKSLQGPKKLKQSLFICSLISHTPICEGLGRAETAFLPDNVNAMFRIDMGHDHPSTAEAFETELVEHHARVLAVAVDALLIRTPCISDNLVARETSRWWCHLSLDTERTAILLFGTSFLQKAFG
jgi:hypothetical protein